MAGYPRPFGNYVLLEAFSQGGMGEVYISKRGVLEGMSRLSVLKKLRADFAENREYIGRFVDEARVAVILQHANIAQVFDVGRVDEEYYIAMDYVSGVNLRGVYNLAREKLDVVPTDLAVYIVGQVLDALDYIHRFASPKTGKALNIVHRDVSPQNVMLSYEGEVKLIDFGLAQSELKTEMTESQVVMGKVEYMSPEQARGLKVDRRADQFAAAVLLYEILTGERFYADKSRFEIWQVVGSGKYQPPKFEELPAALREILRPALSSEPGERYHSCGDFRDKLTQYLSASGTVMNPRKLRDYLLELMPDDIEKERERLADFAQVDPKNFTAEVDRDTTVSLLSPLAGVDMAVFDDPGPESGSSGVFAPSTIDETEGETDAVIRAADPGRKRRPLVALLALLILLLGSAAIWLATRDRTPTVVKVAPKKVAPKKVAPKEVAPKEVAPKEVAPKEVAPKEAMPKEVAPEEVMPKEVAPRKKKAKKKKIAKLVTEDTAKEQGAKKEPGVVSAEDPVEEARRYRVVRSALRTIQSCDAPCTSLYPDAQVADLVARFGSVQRHLLKCETTCLQIGHK